MIIRETQRLILREWKESDRDLFREINADEKVMEFFPFRRSHAEADAVLETINGMIRGSGYGFMPWNCARPARLWASAAYRRS